MQKKMKALKEKGEKGEKGEKASLEVLLLLRLFHMQQKHRKKGCLTFCYPEYDQWQLVL
jgi:hypothetical protein